MFEKPANKLQLSVENAIKLWEEVSTVQEKEL